MAKSYSKFTHEDLKALGLQTILTHLFERQIISPVQPSEWLKETLSDEGEFSLDTEKARSEFIVAPILRELQKNNKETFAVYSGFNFDVDKEKGLQGFCDFLLAKLPLNVIPDTPIIAVVEAKLSGSLSAAVPQCAAEMYATRLWNEKKGEPTKVVYGIITNGENWLFLRYNEGMTIEVDKNSYPLKLLSELLGVCQYVINQAK